MLKNNAVRVIAGTALLCGFLWLFFVAEMVQTAVYSDKYVSLYHRSSLWCFVKDCVTVHTASCSSRYIRVASEEWRDPAGGVVGYWRDPADGAILFSTGDLGSNEGDIYLVMPSGRPQYHARIPYSGLIHFGGGDLGAAGSEVAVKRLESQTFQLKWANGEGEPLIVSLLPYKE